MWKYVSLLFLPLLLLSQDLEVRLATQSTLQPIYLTAVHSAEILSPLSQECREILAFDLNAGGWGTVVPQRDALEQSFHFPDVRNPFDRSLWKKEQIPFCIALYVQHNQLEVTAFNVEQGTAKKYPPISLDRGELHRLADKLHQDLFGCEGIASLRLIYAQRQKNPKKPTEKGLDWLSEIWVSDADGANARQVTFENSYCLSPYFIPHSADQFFYVSEKSGQSKIYRASLSHPQGEVFIEMRGNQALPAISQKGLQLAFITDIAGRPDLFLQTLDAQGHPVGKARQIYSAPRATQATPTFSPDGKKVAFVSDKDGPPRIYVLEITGSKRGERARPKLITKKNRENTSPSWSPDGTKLAYSAKVEGIRQIWVYDFVTEEEIPLTTGRQIKENPSWAPDSFHLVYNTESEESCELYLIHLNGGEPIQISHGPGQKRFASWEPR